MANTQDPCGLCRRRQTWARKGMLPEITKAVAAGLLPRPGRQPEVGWDPCGTPGCPGNGSGPEVCPRCGTPVRVRDYGGGARLAYCGACGAEKFYGKEL